MSKRLYTLYVPPGQHSNPPLAAPWWLCFQLLAGKGKVRLEIKSCTFSSWKKKGVVPEGCGSAINAEWQGFLVAGMGIPRASSSCRPESGWTTKLACLNPSYSRPVTGAGVQYIPLEKGNKKSSRSEICNGGCPVRKSLLISPRDSWKMHFWCNLIVCMQNYSQNYRFLTGCLRNQVAQDCSFSPGLALFCTHSRPQPISWLHG